jgi:hypothetical protein
MTAIRRCRIFSSRDNWLFSAVAGVSATLAAVLTDGLLSSCCRSLAEFRLSDPASPQSPDDDDDDDEYGECDDIKSPTDGVANGAEDADVANGIGVANIADVAGGGSLFTAGALASTAGVPAPV